MSEVNSQSKHDPLSFESVLAFRRVAHLVPENTPVILESRVEEDGIDDEIENACKALIYRLSWKWRERSSGKIAERTYEKRTEALHC